MLLQFKNNVFIIASKNSSLQLLLGDTQLYATIRYVRKDYYMLCTKGLYVMYERTVICYVRKDYTLCTKGLLYVMYERIIRYVRKDASWRSI